MVFSVRFARMWQGFDPNHNILLPLIESAVEERVQVVASRKVPVDLEVGGPLVSERRRIQGRVSAGLRRGLGKVVDSRSRLRDPGKSSNAMRGIWFTGENVRPPDANWDLSLSFDASGWPATNVYLPLWMLFTDAFGGGESKFLGEVPKSSTLALGRSPEEFDRTRFCCAFIRNPDPVRRHAIEALSTLGEVRVFGLGGSTEVPSKLEAARDFQFMLCFENDLYPGYVTEKPIEAWYAGCIPIWWGLDRDGLLNRSALVNFADFRTLDEATSHIHDLQGSRDLMARKYAEPILNAPINIEPVIQAIRLLFR